MMRQLTMKAQMKWMYFVFDVKFTHIRIDQILNLFNKNKKGQQ